MTSSQVSKKKMNLKSSSQVLRYSPVPATRTTVRNYYAKWRKEQGIPPRCDMPDCHFNLHALEWNSIPLPVILDHVNGNNLDNRPENLRYLCPNCDAQLPTRGGRNRGRVVEAVTGGYALLRKDGLREFHLICETGVLKAEGFPATIIVTPSDDAK
ncbi:hypothetical protein EKL02_11065 [Janthinobacterium sp. 17J80-10]|nr:hypothetical protein EKL02_11065 [Janthinobacterium sp. 17J80-10]